MTVSVDTIKKMESLTPDNMNIVVDLVNQLSLNNPMDIFSALCQDGAQNPMTEEEVSNFVSDVRKERNAFSN